jgi:IS605 OrfB family transposase
MTYIKDMKLTLQIKLLPDDIQAKELLETIKKFNDACNAISETAWKEKIFNQYRLQKIVYRSIKYQFKLTAQVVVRCISKVSDSYKLDKKVQRNFKPLGAIAYDSRILSYKEFSVSIWTVDGRLKIPFVCHRPDWLPFVKGEADLVTRRGKFFLLQTVEVPEDGIKDFEEFLGIDFGVVDIVALSNGKNVSSEWINKYRLKRESVRGSIQRKGTRSARRLLKRLSGRERSTATLINHTLSRRIVSEAKMEGLGVAVEDLKGIRKAANKLRKKQKGLRHKWSFNQLRGMLAYKSKLAGIPFVAVDPAYTSQICSACGEMGDRKGKNFSCKACGNTMDADTNAAKNIAARGRSVTIAEKSVKEHKVPNQV